MAYIETVEGRSIQVDDDLVPSLRRFRWECNDGVIARQLPDDDGWMPLADHVAGGKAVPINGKLTDCRRRNLRLVHRPRAQRVVTIGAPVVTPPPTIPKYVSRTKSGKYRVTAQVNCQMFRFGTFADLAVAAEKAREVAAWVAGKRDMPEMHRNLRTDLPTGIYTKRERYCAAVWMRRKHHYLGTFDTIKDAIAARTAFLASMAA